ncbi:penicillin-binding transpeptidase domain-containing protein, partial [Streptomyces asiaticus]
MDIGRISWDRLARVDERVHQDVTGRGDDPEVYYYNNATREDYQPASTFKPLILAAGLENGSTT